MALCLESSNNAWNLLASVENVERFISWFHGYSVNHSQQYSINAYQCWAIDCCFWIGYVHDGEYINIVTVTTFYFNVFTSETYVYARFCLGLNHDWFGQNNNNKFLHSLVEQQFLIKVFHVAFMNRSPSPAWFVILSFRSWTEKNTMRQRYTGIRAWRNAETI